MDLEKDLEKSKKVRLENSANFVDSCKLLLDSNQAEELQILRSLGLDTQIKEAEKNIEMQVLNDKYTEEYQSKIFHISEIEKLALKYRLFLRSSKMYRGAIPPDLGSIINRLIKEKKIVIGKHSDYNNNFFVMAPPKMFKGYDSFWNKVKDVHELTTDTFHSFVETFKDPILFYKVDDEHFLLLKKWGDDFDSFRTSYALMVKTKNAVRLSVGFVISTIIFGIPSIVYNLVSKGTFENNGPTFPGVVFGVGSIALIAYGVIAYCVWYGHDMAKDTNTKDNFYKY